MALSELHSEVNDCSIYLDEQIVLVALLEKAAESPVPFLPANAPWRPVLGSQGSSHFSQGDLGQQDEVL